jgi:Flp pilus assembly protein TadD
VLKEVEGFVAIDDFDPQARLRWVRALLLARRGQVEEAERLAREAVAIIEPTDYVDIRGDALSALASVLDTAGRRDDAVLEWRRALECYERKGNIVRTTQVREHLA